MNFSEAVLTKARKLLTSERVKRDDEHPAIWWVGSSAGDRTYRVQSDFNPATRRLSWVTCTCPHGLNKGAGKAHCYHVCSVLMLLREDKPLIPVGGPDGVVAFAKVSPEDYERLSTYSWSIAGRGYARLGRPGGGADYMHRLVLITDKQVDHINGDPLDNRRENLREATNAQNHSAFSSRAPGVSGVRGVSRDRNKWQARVTHLGKTYRKGGFDTVEEAADWWDLKAEELYGEFFILSRREERSE